MPFDIKIAPNRNPLDTISDFLKQLKDFLGRLFETPVEFGLEYNYDIQTEIMTAFQEETVRSFETTQTQLRDADPEKLYEHGLTGHSLHAKMTGINVISDAVNRHALRAIRYLLSLVNSILGSIASIAGAAGAIKEIKDLFESTTDFVKGK
ncbi:hypothetical protein [Aliiroseovarius sp. F47248L]|uniref:hypothetical protein n=1 Tax=Aliiroseovarius sp. F47248L TaxID=2926420 RepID=UPI001FF48F36|nr:hypothetical protein [Aliiroseovarius sp. F47248L]MCK0138430.1 hypothetical protein [Aliiroseovarius sp. F47248L]